VVDEIFDSAAARKMGIDNIGQVGGNITFHEQVDRCPDGCGSGGR